MRNVPEIIKEAFVGSTISQVTQPSREIDYSTNDLERFIRKHPKLNLPEVEAQIDLNAGLDKLTKSFDSGDINYEKGGEYSFGGFGITGPGRKTISEGHELGHAKDFVTKGDNFFGERGAFGFGGNAASMLESESSATNNILDELSANTKRTHGKELAHAYDTYLDEATFDLEKQMTEREYRKKYGKSSDVLQKATDGFDQSDIEYKREYDFTQKSSNPLHRIYEKNRTHPGTTLRLHDELDKRRKAIENSVNRKNSKNIQKILESEREIITSNRAKLINNLKTMNPSDNKAIKKETLKYINDIRKTFGNDVAKGVIDDVRSIRSDYYKKYPKKLIEKGIKNKRLKYVGIGASSIAAGLLLYNGIKKKDKGLEKTALAKILRKGK